MRYKGKLSQWNDDKGFGFVEPNGGGDRAFVHITSFQRPSRRPVEGDLIIYQQVKEANGRFKAMDVSLVADGKVRPQPAKRAGTGGTLLVFLFSVILAATVVLGLLPITVLYLYCITSLLTFVLYAFDKSAAQKGSWRTPESHLHLLSLIGGWPGAYFAQRKIRHKSSKMEFKRVFWATIIINIAVFLWLFTEQGQQFLTTFVG